MRVWEQADHRFLAEYGHVATRAVSDIVKTMSIQRSAEYFVETFGLPDDAEYVMERIESLVEGEYFYRIPEKAGARALLQRLRENGFRLCIATATYRRLAEAICNRLGFTEYLEFMLTCSEVGETKTSPAIFHACAERMGLERAELAVVEDALHSIVTARAAGYYTFAVHDEFSEPERDKIIAASNRFVENLNMLGDILIAGGNV